MGIILGPRELLLLSAPALGMEGRMCAGRVWRGGGGAIVVADVVLNWMRLNEGGEDYMETLINQSMWSKLRMPVHCLTRRVLNTNFRNPTSL